MLQSNLTCGEVSGWPLENEWICCGMGVLQAHSLDPVGDKFKGSVAPQRRQCGVGQLNACRRPCTLRAPGPEPLNTASGPIVNEVLKIAEDNRDSITIILAGYEDRVQGGPSVTCFEGWSASCMFGQGGGRCGIHDTMGVAQDEMATKLFAFDPGLKSRFQADSCFSHHELFSTRSRPPQGSWTGSAL